MTNTRAKHFATTLENEAADYGLNLDSKALDALVCYYEVLEAWNARLHLVAPTSPREFATRHILESLLLVHHLPKDARVADVGSGAGLPILPCLIVRPDLRATLIEASKRKSIFLREALNATNTQDRAEVIADRFENIDAPDVTFVTCRALERFEEVLPGLVKWSPAHSTLALFGNARLGERLKELNLEVESILIPKSKSRFLLIARKLK